MRGFNDSAVDFSFDETHRFSIVQSIDFGCESFDAEWEDMFIDDYLEMIIKYLPNIRQIHMKKCQFSAGVFQDVIQECKSLNIFDVSFTNIKSFGLSILASIPNKITHLKLNGIFRLWRISPTNLFLVLEHHHSLKYLELNECPDIYIEHIERVKTDYPKVQIGYFDCNSY